MENLHCQRNLTVGLLSVYLVNKIQFRMSLYFELFDLENFRFRSQKLHLAVKSNLGSLLWFDLSLRCQRSFLGQYSAKLSYLCKNCKGAKIALNPPPYNTTDNIFEIVSITIFKKLKLFLQLYKYLYHYFTLI